MCRLGIEVISIAGVEAEPHLASTDTFGMWRNRIGAATCDRFAVRDETTAPSARDRINPKIDLRARAQVIGHWLGIGVTLFVNRAVQPFSMAALVWPSSAVYFGHPFPRRESTASPLIDVPWC